MLCLIKIPTAILSTTAKALARSKRGEESKSAIKTERKVEEPMEVVCLILCECLGNIEIMNFIIKMH